MSEELTFAARLAATKQTSLKSDLDNLSHAYLHVEKAELSAKTSYEKFLAEAAKVKAEIERLGAAPGDLPEGSVRDLYNKAHNLFWSVSK